MLNNVQFHADGYERQHVAINVKIYSNFPLTRRLEPYFARLGYSHEEFEAYVESYVEGLTQRWWDEDVQEKAKSLGFDGVFSEGRSNGWAAPYFGNGRFLYEEDMEKEEFRTMYENLIKFCNKSVDGLDASVYHMLRDEYQALELEFLQEHSVAVRSLISWQEGS